MQLAVPRDYSLGRVDADIGVVELAIGAVDLKQASEHGDLELEGDLVQRDAARAGGNGLRDRKHLLPRRVLEERVAGDAHLVERADLCAEHDSLLAEPLDLLQVVLLQPVHRLELHRTDPEVAHRTTAGQVTRSAPRPRL